MKYQKLVRDKIPEIIAAGGEKAVIRKLDNDEYLEKLVKKLKEECEEFALAKNLEELADIQEVILALADKIANRAELEVMRKKKLEERGGFSKRVFLEETL